MKNLVVLTGAGISAESGIKTFRDAEGLWEGHDVMEVASPQGFYNNPALVLDFYNQRRKQLLSVKPNNAHLNLKKLETYFNVQIITQNVDNLHERANCKNVIHLHGELFKVQSTSNPNLVYDWETDLVLGDLCEEKSQLRPDIVWFGEDVPLLEKAAEITLQADILVIIGTSMQVYPAASLINYTKPYIPIFFIDPKPYSIFETLCSNESYSLSNGTVITTSGIYQDTIQTSQGCDSIVTINLTVNNFYTETIAAEICGNETYTLPNGQVVNVSGTYIDTLISASLCDSVLITNLIVSLAPVTNTTQVCTNVLANAGVIVDTLFTVSGCDSVYNELITVYETIDTYVLGPETICEGESYEILGIMQTEPGSYSDTITSVLGCDSLIREQTLIVNLIPNASVGNDTTITLGNSATLNAGGGTSYTWNSGETTSTILVSPQSTTIYTVSVDENGCTDTASITVFVIDDDVEILIPNAFTPNADNLNDVFKIVNEADFEKITIRVYNRWGEMVFSSTDSITAWDGTFNGDEQAEDEYIYYIQAIAKSNQKDFKVSGSVAIIR